MPTWTYGDWRSQTTAADRLARLNLHLQEVSNRIGQERDAGDLSVSSHALGRYITLLEEQREKLVPQAAIETGDIPGGGRLKAVFL